MVNTYGFKITGLREVAEKSNEFLNDNCPFSWLTLVYNENTGLLRSIERLHEEVHTSISHLLEDGDISSTLGITRPMTMQQLADEVVITVAMAKYRKVMKKAVKVDFAEDKLTPEEWLVINTDGFTTLEAYQRFAV